MAPKLNSAVVERREINRLLAESSAAWFHAPAGYGKSTSALAWLNTMAAAPGWYQVAMSDDSPRQFMRYLIAAIDRILPLPITLHQVAAHLDDHGEALLTQLLHIVERHGAPVVLGIDDLHLLQQPAVLALLAQLVLWRPANMWLALTSRQPPPAPLMRACLSGHLTLIGSDQLCLSLAETTALLRQRLADTPPPAAIQALHQAYHGWVAGLSLALLGTTDISQLMPSSRNFPLHTQLFDFLFGEFYRQQSVAMQQLMLATAIVDHLSPPLALALCPGQSRLLAELLRTRPFLSAEGDHYRWHQLVLEVLRQQLEQYPERVHHWCDIASNWYLQHNAISQAGQVVLRWGDAQQVMVLLDLHRHRLWHAGEGQLLQQLLQRLPHHQLASHPQLQLLDARLALSRGLNSVGLAKVTQLEQQRRHLPPNLRHDLDALCAYILQLQMNYPAALALADAALTALSPAHEGYHQARQVHITCLHELGQLDSAQPLAEQLLTNALLSELPAIAIWAYTKLTYFLAYRRQFNDALTLATKGLALAKACGQNGSHDHFRLLHGYVQLLLNVNQLDNARAQLPQVLSLGAAIGGQAHIRALMQHGWLALASEDWSEVQPLMEQLEQLRPSACTDGLHIYLDNQLTGWWLHCRDRPRLQHWLTGTDLPPPTTGHKYAIALRCQIRAQWLCDQHARARERLTHLLEITAVLDEPLERIYSLDLALTLATDEPAGIRGLWLNTLLDLCLSSRYLLVFQLNAALYRELLTSPPSPVGAAHQRFVTLIRQQLNRHRERSDEIPAALAMEGISCAEYRVLQLIAGGLTNAQICQKLHLSEATVKSHINRSYRKLGVTSRSAAAALVQQMSAASHNAANHPPVQPPRDEQLSIELGP